MRCTNCGTEIGGKRYCPSCGNEVIYDGASQGRFPGNHLFKKIVQAILNPRTLFLLACLGVVIAAQTMAN